MLWRLPMIDNRYTMWPLLCACVFVTACGSPAPKKSDILDIYDLPRGAQGKTIYVMPVDNDMYYTQPGGYSGCAQIGDAPSCGGG